MTFELERFGWTGGDSRLEVAGRWRGPRIRRLGPATLVVSADGRRRLSAAIVTGDARAEPEPTLWRAEYPWDGGQVGGFELEVGQNLIIELPPPEGSPPHAPAAAPQDLEPLRAELDAAQRQIEAERAEALRLRDELLALRRDAFDLEQTREFLRLAQATAEAERKAVRAAREQAASRRARTASEPGPAGTEAPPAREEAAALKADLARSRDEAAAALRDVERLRGELLQARASAGGAADELGRRERVVEEEPGEAPIRVRRLSDEPTIAATGIPIESSEADGQVMSEPAETLVIERPRRRGPVRVGARRAPAHQPRERERVTVVAQRTPPAPRRYAQRPPRASPALRAIAGVLLLLLVVVLVTLLLMVT